MNLHDRKLCVNLFNHFLRFEFCKRNFDLTVFQELNFLFLQFFFELVSIGTVNKQVVFDKRLFDFFGCAVAYNLSVIDDCDMIGPLCLIKIMSCEKNGGVLLFSHLLQVIPQAFAADRIKS